MSDNSLVLGIYQLGIFEILKERDSIESIDSVCREIVSLGKCLKELNENDEKFEEQDDPEMEEILENITSSIKESGSFLNSIGGYKLMLAVCQLVSLENDNYGGLLNSMWDGIGDWWA